MVVILHIRYIAVIEILLNKDKMINRKKARVGSANTDKNIGSILLSSKDITLSDTNNLFFFHSRYQHSSFITREKGNSDGLPQCQVLIETFRWSMMKLMIIIVLFNYQDPIKRTKRTRVRLNRNLAPYSRLTTNVIGPHHECKKVCPCTKARLLLDIRA